MASALIQPLFTTPAMEALLDDRATIARWLSVEAALAEAQAEMGLVPSGLAPAIRALDPAGFDIAAIGAAAARAGVPSIPFLKDVERRLPADLAPHLHKGATTQDLIDSGTALLFRDVGVELDSGLTVVGGALSALAERHRATAQVGRTYGQHAVPTSFGHTVAVWLSGVTEAMQELRHAVEGVTTLSLFGPVGTLHAIGPRGPALLEAVAGKLGLGAPAIATHANRFAMARFGAALGLTLGALAKMATDIERLAATEIGEVAEPWAPGRGGSSAMPHKRNPVGATVILAAHEAGRGHVGTLLASQAAAHQRPAGAWHAEWLALPELLRLTAAAIHEAGVIAGGLEVNIARMRANLDLTGGLLFADALAAALGPKLGRGAAHALVEEIATTSRASGATFQALARADARVTALLDTAALDHVFDPGPAVAAAAPWIDRARAAWIIRSSPTR